MSGRSKNCPQYEEKDGAILALKELEEIFEDYKLRDTDPDEYDRRENIRDYAEAKKQIGTMKTITFGSKINMLLITDRLPGCAKGLREYLQNSADITVDLVNTMEESQQIINKKPIDFLIIVGCLKHDENYKTIEAVKQFNKYASIIMYASLDIIIEKLCAKNRITNTYDRDEPMDGFVSYMKKCYDEQNDRLYRDFSIGKDEERTEKLRKQAWLEAIQTAKCDAERNAQKKEQLRLKAIKKERRNKILSYSGMTVLIIMLLGFCVFEWYQSGLSNDTKKYTYNLQDHEGSLVINISVNDENVKVTLNRVDDNAAGIYEKTGVLTIESALKNELIHEKQGRLCKSYVFVEQRILLYCLMELAAY